jgi:hypothetical protein
MERSISFGFAAYSLARHVTATEGLRLSYVLGILLAAAGIGTSTAEGLGTIRESDGDPIRPSYEVYTDTDRPPPTPFERQVRGWTVFALIAIPAGFGFASGRKAHAHNDSDRKYQERLVAERRARVANAPVCSCGERSHDRCRCCGTVMCWRCYVRHTR